MKHSTPGLITPELLEFPLGKTGGLIEADGSHHRAIDDALSFRWVKPAASLKRHAFARASSINAWCFRWVKPAASLKHRGDRLAHLIRGVSAG